MTMNASEFENLLRRVVREELDRPKSRKPKGLNGHAIGFDMATANFIGITEADELRWQEAYPAVPIPPEIAKAAAWLHANPANRKKNNERFLVNWFARSQDRAGRVRR